MKRKIENVRIYHNFHGGFLLQIGVSYYASMLSFKFLFFSVTIDFKYE